MKLIVSVVGIANGRWKSLILKHQEQGTQNNGHPTQYQGPD